MNEQRNLEKQTEILNRAVCVSQRMLDDFRLATRSTTTKSFLLMVLDEITRKSRGVVTLSEAGPKSWAGISAIARSAFESYADLKNLLNFGDEYAYFMVWQSLRQQASLFRGVVDFPNSRYSKSVELALRTEHGSDAKTIVGVTEKEMKGFASKLPKQFKDKNGRVFRTDKIRFKLASLDDEYEMLYRRLSAGAHGRVSDISGNLVYTDQSGEFRWPPLDPEPPLAAVASLTAILLDSCRLVARRYRKALAPINALGREHLSLDSEKWPQK